MNKQTTAFVAIILITCLLGFGVESMFNMTALERLETILTADVELESYRMDAKGSINMNLESENEVPQYLEQMFKMYDNMELSIQADVVSKPDNYQMKMLENIDVGGMQFDVEIYLKDYELLIKYPIIGNYISITLDDIKDLTGIELPETFEQDVLALIPMIEKDMTEIVLTHLTDENVQYKEPYLMNNDGYEQTLNVIEITMDSETIIQIYADVILSLLNNDEGLALIEEVIEMNGESLPEDFKSELSEVKILVEAVKDPESDARAELKAELGPILDNLEYTYDIGLSNLNIPKMMWMKMDMRFPVDEYNGVDMHMVYDLEYRLSKFNEIDEIVLPQLEESDVIRVHELIEQFGGF